MNDAKKAKYIAVTKPGIILGNLITVSGGFFFGSLGFIHIWVYVAALVGVSLVMASGCVYNNVIDRDIDALMQRTKNRELVTGLITPKSGLRYASLLGILGLFILYFFATPLAALVAFIGLFVYVVFYSLYAKRFSIFGTEIGAISGASPPVVGYCAATGTFDLGALAVFLILFFWQLPHSYAIAINRLEDYKAAAIPVLPARVSIQATKLYMLIFTCMFILATLLPSFFGYTGYLYLMLEVMLGIIWLIICIKGFVVQDDKHWAKQMFVASILLITAFSLIISLAASFHF